MSKNIILTEQQMNNLLKSVLGFAFGSDNKEDTLKTSTNNDNTKSSSISTDFNSMINKIIDTFEGGYYDPETMKSSAMGESGETMYGMDAKASDMLKTSAGKKFWDLIHEDKEKNPSCWKYNYDPEKAGGKCSNPTLAKQLKDLIVQIMKPDYDKFSNMFLTPESREIVNSDPGLLFNFTYCVWNGPGFFQKFAKVLNKKVENGVRNPKELSKIMIDYRKNFSEYSSFANNLTQVGGKKMEKALGMA
jgi:hypothetical protein